MPVLHVFQLIPRRALVARATARQIASAIKGTLSSSEGVIELDFDGIEAVTPSFVDEILGVIQAVVDQENVGLERIIVSHPPTRLSSKFEAIGRGRNLRVAEEPDGTWVITPTVSEDRSAS